jgi:hypothetical protein
VQQEVEFRVLIEVRVEIQTGGTPISVKFVAITEKLSINLSSSNDIEIKIISRNSNNARIISDKRATKTKIVADN